jgi:tRNA-specific 2-thiouridylase
MMHSKTKVIVGMSGGVDSSVAAFLLQQAGYQVEGLFMKNWEQDDRDEFCAAALDAKDAESVATQLGIPFHTVNFAQDYWDRVFEYFLDEYQAGRTPNPDVMCNKEIKFKAFLNYAKNTLGADFIATGHYAQTQTDKGHTQLIKAFDHTKDQTYFLHALNQDQLGSTLFPIGTLPKKEVRHIAEVQGFITHNKKDSTGICFIGERKFKTFLQEYLPAKPGRIETLEGDPIGEHDGLMYYTIGQRQGLKIGGTANTSNAAWYVTGKDLKNNVLIVVQGENHPALFKIELNSTQLHWIDPSLPLFPLHCKAKTRYRQVDAECIVYRLEDNSYHIVFTEPQRAITPGQSLVLYQGEVCLGGGIIN